MTVLMPKRNSVSDKVLFSIGTRIKTYRGSCLDKVFGRSRGSPGAYRSLSLMA